MEPRIRLGRTVILGLLARTRTRHIALRELPRFEVDQFKRSV